MRKRPDGQLKGRVFTKKLGLVGGMGLPLLFRDRPAPLPCLDTMDIHIRALADEILN